jgi:hypothetical protein
MTRRKLVEEDHTTLNTLPVVHDNALRKARLTVCRYVAMTKPDMNDCRSEAERVQEFLEIFGLDTKAQAVVQESGIRTSSAELYSPVDYVRCSTRNLRPEIKGRVTK